MVVNEIDTDQEFRKCDSQAPAKFLALVFPPCTGRHVYLVG